MHCEGKLKLRLCNTTHCFIEVVTKGGFTVYAEQIKSSVNLLNGNTAITCFDYVFNADKNKFTNNELCRLKGGTRMGLTGGS